MRQSRSLYIFAHWRRVRDNVGRCFVTLEGKFTCCKQKILALWNRVVWPLDCTKYLVIVKDLTLCNLYIIIFDNFTNCVQISRRALACIQNGMTHLWKTMYAARQTVIFLIFSRWNSFERLSRRWWHTVSVLYLYQNVWHNLSIRAWVCLSFSTVVLLHYPHLALGTSQSLQSSRVANTTFRFSLLYFLSPVPAHPRLI